MVGAVDSQAQIKQAMQGNFLFQSLTEKQLNTLCECMELVEVNAGDIVIRQVRLLRDVKLSCMMAAISCFCWHQMADNWTMLLVHPFKLNPSIFFMSGNPD